MISGRSAGIILHITSLPSPYGIGDLGPEAYAFANFLAKAGQKYWQILPLNPTEPASGNSPYSGLSAFAGNTMLLSPDLLVKDGLLGQESLQASGFPNDGQVDFGAVINFKNKLFHQVFLNIENMPVPQLMAYKKFCQDEAWWLKDYALYQALKNHFQGMGWSQWPEGIRNRDTEVLQEISQQLSGGIEKEKLLQFLFFKQWAELKAYCLKKEVHFFGDLPFYVGYDSADVWSNKQLFRLDKEQKPITVSGVPPDYFSKTGQLWGTPVFLWKDMKKDGYSWWRKRISQNMRLYELLRLDHFRAFSAYWEVPADEETAIHGSWAKGPGTDFFDHLKQDFPDLPFIAEDLGDIDQDVRDLMQHYDLPGMKVLLFAFGEGLAQNAYAPHHHIKNCLVYTGTHDNNTIRGWFGQDADAEDIKRLSQYINRPVHRDNVHEEMIHMALKSVANVVVIPMQDHLGLGQEAIMNKPSVAHGNWAWRMEKGAANAALAEKIKGKIEMFDRSGGGKAEQG